MECTVGPALFAALSCAERAWLVEKVALTSLEGLFTAVPDPRSRHGQRYTLSFLLTCLVAALVCNCDGLDAVGRWCRDRRTLLAEVMGPLRHLTPRGSLYRKLLPRLNAAAIEAVVSVWVQATLHAPSDEPLVADGKTVRGAVTAEAPAPHLLSVSTMYTQETLLQVRVDDKTNEIPVLQAALPLAPVAGRVVMADALHTQVATAHQIVELGGHSVLTVKKNQPALYDALTLFFAQPTAPLQDARTVDYAHSRREERVGAYLNGDEPLRGRPLAEPGPGGPAHPHRQHQEEGAGQHGGRLPDHQPALRCCPASPSRRPRAGLLGHRKQAPLCPGCHL